MLTTGGFSPICTCAGRRAIAFLGWLGRLTKLMLAEVARTKRGPNLGFSGNFLLDCTKRVWACGGGFGTTKMILFGPSAVSS